MIKTIIILFMIGGILSGPKVPMGSTTYNINHNEVQQMDYQQSNEDTNTKSIIGDIVIIGAAIARISKSMFQAIQPHLENIQQNITEQ